KRAVNLQELRLLARKRVPKAVFDYFVLGQSELEEEGLFKGIHELPPSMMLTIDLESGDIKKQQYYELQTNSNLHDNIEEQTPATAEKIRELVFNAIDIRLRSDVHVGSCLSGGLDSSSIVCVINELLKKEKLEQVGDKQATFTASFDIQKFDESKWAKMVVDHTKTTWQQTFPDKDGLVKDLEDLVYSQDIPFWSTSTYAQYCVMRLVSESGVKVVLDGQGGDELFAGYRHYYHAYWKELLHKNKFKKLFQELSADGGTMGNLNFMIKSSLKNFISRSLPSTAKEMIIKNYFQELQYLNSDLWHQHKNRLSILKPDYKPSLNKTLQDQFYNSL
ncbi:MAG: hypothetical protein IH946_04345, partial [Bacteroidetes bacterium]|nr:hypothetical protein [Bacteroidota bacterium]